MRYGKLLFYNIGIRDKHFHLGHVKISVADKLRNGNEYVLCLKLWRVQERRAGMLAVFLEHRVLTLVFLILLLLSIICQSIIGVIFKRMIRESDNMATTSNKRLKQCKLKFMNCFQLNGSVANVSVFVDKFLTKLTFCGVSLTGIQHLSGQLVLLSVAAAGIGACREIIQGGTLGNVLPYYIASFLGLYIYFSVSGMVDVQGKRERLKISLVDYLENHMSNKLRQSAIDWEGLTGEQIIMIKERLEQERRGKPETQVKQGGNAAEAAAEGTQDRETDREEDEEGRKGWTLLSRQEEQELEELLREFFI